jgi:hypothetical protein
MPFAQEPDCGPARVLYCEPGVQLVRAATANLLVYAFFSKASPCENEICRRGPIASS